MHAKVIIMNQKRVRAEDRVKQMKTYCDKHKQKTAKVDDINKSLLEKNLLIQLLCHRFLFITL